MMEVEFYFNPFVHAIGNIGQYWTEAACRTSISSVALSSGFDFPACIAYNNLNFTVELF